MVQIYVITCLAARKVESDVEYETRALISLHEHADAAKEEGLGVLERHYPRAEGWHEYQVAAIALPGVLEENGYKATITIEKVEPA